MIDDGTTVRWALGVNLIAGACLVFGAWCFWRHGGVQVTAVGVYSFAFALFVGFGGLYHAPGNIVGSLVLGLAIVYALQVITYCIWWSDDRQVRPKIARSAFPAAVTRWGTAMGALWLMGGFAGTYLQLGFLATQVAFAGGALTVTSMYMRRASGLKVGRSAIAVAVLAAFTLYIFTGFGRLELGALGLAFVVASSGQFRQRTVKAGLLLVSVPVMIYLAQQRVAFNSQLIGAQSRETGFESAAGPIVDFSRLLGWSIDGTLGVHGLSTLYASSVALVPRELWSGKPVGFGAVLGDLLRPDLIGVGHSQLALFHGEWVWSLGWLGLVLMPPVVGLLIRRLDVTLTGALAATTKSRRGLLALVATIILVCGLPDLLWGGTFTYVSRAGVRLLVLLPLLAFAPAQERVAPARQPARRR